MTRGFLVVSAMALMVALTVDARDLRRQNAPVRLRSQAAVETTGTGLLIGGVTDPLTDRGVAGALVTLAEDSLPFDTDAGQKRAAGAGSSASAGQRELTDEQGHFVFNDLPPGTYTITASMAGFTDGAYGRRQPSGALQTLALADGERLADLQIPIWKNGAITGTISDDVGETLVDVPVQILRRTVVAGRYMLSPGQVVRTDDRGVYRIGSLAPGDYVVVVPSTQATAPESVADLFFHAVQTARSGSPSDLAPDLLAGSTLSVLRTGLAVGAFRFQSSRMAVAPQPSVDGHIFAYPAQFYPAVMSAAQATVITLRPGEERGGVDVPLKLVSTSRVSGTVAGPDGSRVVGLVLMRSADELVTDVGLETATTVSDTAGRFTFLGVPAGTYVLRVLTAPSSPTGGAPPTTPTGPTWWAAQPVSVGADDISDVVVSLRQGFRIAGSVEFDDAAKQPSPDIVKGITATFESADGRSLPTPQALSSPCDAGGRFQSYQLPPGRYYVRVDGAPAGWTLKRVTVDVRDTSTAPLQLERDISGVVVTLTDHPSELNGQVHNASGASDATATVLIFPAQSATWIDTGATPSRLRQVRTDKDGGYRAVGLPAGDYLIVAVADEAATDWQDPKTLQALARVATSVTVGDGNTRSLALKTVTVSK